LSVRALRVLRYGDAGPNDEFLGALGEKTFRANFRDRVEVEVELSGPAYAYLLAFNPADDPAKQVQLCPRADEDRPPEVRASWKYPANKRYLLNDGVGLQAFAVVASRQPLPAYSAWHRQMPAFTWRKVRATLGFVWRGDGRELARPLKASGDDRGEEVAAPEAELLEGLGAHLHSAPGVEAVGLIAFGVAP
jgi:hypothetical protein